VDGETWGSTLAWCPGDTVGGSEGDIELEAYGGGGSRRELSSICPPWLSSSSSSSSPTINVSSSLTAPSTLLDGNASSHFLPFELTAPTPPKHARHGLYLASRGFEDEQVGQIGRAQQAVMNIPSLERGREQEHARQRVVLRSTGTLIVFDIGLESFVVMKKIRTVGGGYWLQCKLQLKSNCG
jgi:hypothetical protein